MNVIIENATISRNNGYGQYFVSGLVNGVEVSAHTTNSEAFDWFDDDSDMDRHQAAIDYVNSLLVRTYENL